VAQADPNKRRSNAGSTVSERTLWTWLRWYEEAGDIRGLLPHAGDRGRGRPSKSEELHQIIADRLEARWLQRPPWPLTDVALFALLQTARSVQRYFFAHQLRIPRLEQAGLNAGKLLWVRPTYKMIHHVLRRRHVITGSFRGARDGGGASSSSLREMHLDGDG
jgi:hypothetical protein